MHRGVASLSVKLRFLGTRGGGRARERLDVHGSTPRPVAHVTLWSLTQGWVSGEGREAGAQPRIAQASVACSGVHVTPLADQGATKPQGERTIVANQAVVPPPTEAEQLTPPKTAGQFVR